MMPNMMMVGRWTTVAYGVACYLAANAVMLGAVLFVGNGPLPRTLDQPSDVPWPLALLINTVLLGLFALQHSGMARQPFKRWWIRIIPAPIERSTYVLFSALAFVLLFGLWQPMPAVIWDVGPAAVRWLLLGLSGAGLLVLTVASCTIDHFELFGLRQVWLFALGRPCPVLPFRTPGLYGYVRHPIMFGLLLAVWAAPTMSAGRLLLAGAFTLYVLVALRWEEHDLIACYGDAYVEYRGRVPLLLPGLRPRPAQRARS